MRREQILKICLNHVLTSDIIYKKKDDKSWSFIANDFSENTVETTSFCLRFKSAEIATEFKEAVDAALSGEGQVTEEPSSTCSSEERNLVKRLQLPEDFFAYKSASKCPGCRGCKSDEFVFPTSHINGDDGDVHHLPLKTPNIKVVVKKPEPKKSVSFIDYENKENQKVHELFGAGIKKTVSKIEEPTATAPKPNIFALAKSPESVNIFSGALKSAAEKSPPNVFATSAKSIFSSSLNTTPITTTNNAVVTPATIKAAPLFGSQESTVSKPSSEGGNIFGGKGTFSFGNTGSSIFSNKSDTSAAAAQDLPSGNIFGGTFGAQTNTTSIFGSSLTSSASAPVFGSNSVATTFSFASAAKELTSSPEVSSSSNIFASASGPAFGSNVAEKSAEPSDAVPEFLKKDTALSFASLASGVSTENSFMSKADGSPNPKGGFFGLTIKEDFFSKFANKSNISGAGDGDTDNNESNNDEYDPHYEPIISLPDEIKVSTGEEDEEKIFGERAKLFRYDIATKEWKERGLYK